MVPMDPEIEAGSLEYVTALRDALKAFCGSPKGLSIWTALGKDVGAIHRVRIPRIGKEQIPGAIFWALKREEPFEDEATVIDFELDPEPPAQDTAQLSATGFLAPREEVDRVAKIFSQAGFPLSGIALPLCALQNLFRSRILKQDGSSAVLSRIGMKSTQVSVMDKGRLVMTRSIPVSLLSLAESLTKELQPPPTLLQAKTLVLGPGTAAGDPKTESSWNEDEVIAILFPALQRIARQIERTIKYYHTTANPEGPVSVYLAGPMAANQRLMNCVATELANESIVINPFASATAKSSDHTPKGKAEQAAFTQAYGLALSGRGETPNLIGTYKDRERIKRTEQVNRAIFAFFLIMTTACGIFYGWQRTQLSELRNDEGRLSSSSGAERIEINQAALLTAIADLRVQRSQMEETARQYEGVALLTEINQVTPDHVRLLQLSARIGNSGQEERQTPPRQLRMEGVVSGERASLEILLAAYQTRLERSPLLQNIRIDESRVRNTESGAQLSFVLNADLTS